LGNRAGGLVSRYRNVAADLRFLRVVRLDDAKTMEAHLRDLLEEMADDTALLVYVTPDGKLVGGARHDARLSLEDFARDAAGPVRLALTGEIGSGCQILADQAMNVVAVPVVVPERGLAGVLVAGVRLSEAALQHIKAPQLEIL